MNFTKLIQIIKDNKKNITVFFMFFVVFYLFSDVTFAASTDFESLKSKTAEFTEFLLKWISLLLALITYLATMFLSPEWINGSLFWLNVYFHEIWILVSNVVYFIFAFILIWIAFMNIIGKTWEMYQLKQALPKFIVWVIIVPFSWFLVQFVLSLSAVLTVASLSLPFDTFDEYAINLEWVTVPVECTLNLQSFSAGEAWWQAEKKDDWFISCDDKKPGVPLTQIAKNWDAIESIFWVISMYTYWVLSLDTMDEVKINKDVVKTMWDLIVKIVFDLLFVIVYSILIITLWMVLMIRWIYIWIYMMMSPVFWLMYFFWKGKWWDWFFGKFNLKEFIALAMVPVYSMLALSFWLLFLYVVGTWIAWWSTQSSDGKISLENEWIKVWKFHLNINWAVSKADNATGLLVNVWNWSLWVVWSLILKIFGIVILWWTIMAALRTSDITKQIVEPIYKFGSQVWGIMTSLPWNIPIFPTGKGWMQSMSSLSNVWGSIQSSISSINSDRAKKLSDQLPFVWNDKVTENARNNQKEISWANDDNKKSVAAKNVLASANWDSTNLYNNDNIRNNLYEIAKKILTEKWLSDLWVKSQSDIKNLEIVAKIYDEIEKKAPAYRDVMPENVWWINEAAIKKAVKDYKDNDTSTSSNNTWSSNNTNNVNISVSNVLSWLWVEVQLTKWSNWKYDKTDDDAYVAENIESINNKWLIKKFDDSLLNNLRKYYDAQWKYVEWWNQNWWKFPWEVNNPTPNP